MACNCGCGSGGVNSLGCGCGGVGPCNQLGVSQNEVNTPNCTGQTGVNMSVCGQSAGQLCSCNNCGCQQAAQCVPTPYYVQSQGCQEGHDRVLINQQWAMSGKTLESFAIPTCNPPASIVVTVPGLMQIMIGSYVQFVVSGTPIYLKVIAFDYVTHRVTLQNDACRYGVLSPGTVIPACSLFNIATLIPVAPDTTSSSYPYLAADWTVPAVGDCATFTNLTTSVGLSAGQIVSILGATYTVSVVHNSTQVTLCNNTGHGGTPGDVIIAHDYAGNHIVPVVGLTTNPCTNPTVTAGSLLVCHGGVQQPLAGSLDGQVPVLNHTTGEVTFQNVPFETLPCVGLLAPCVSLAQGATSGTLTFKVDDNDPAVIEVNDIVQIAKDGHIYQFEVTAAPVSAPANIVADLKAVDGVVGGAVPAPGVSFACEDGVDQLCLAPCCDQLQEQIDDINVDITNIETSITNLTNTVNNNYTNIVNVQIPCARKVDNLSTFSGTTVINIDPVTGNWNSCGILPGGGNFAAGVYLDEDLTNPGTVAFALPNAAATCGASNTAYYLLVVTGQIEAVLDANAKDQLEDNTDQTSTSMLNSVDLYLTGLGDAFSLPFAYADSAHLSWVSKDLQVQDVAYGAAHLVGGNNDVVDILCRKGLRYPSGTTGNYFPTIGSDGASAIWQHLGTYNELDYFAAPFVITRQCRPSEIINLHCKYRALCKWSAQYQADAQWPTPHCEMRIALYGRAYAIKMSS